MELKKQSFLFLKEDWTFLCEEEQEIKKNIKTNKRRKGENLGRKGIKEKEEEMELSSGRWWNLNFY